MIAPRFAYWERFMRRLVTAGLFALLAHGAEAADMPVLRGALHEAPIVSRPIWQGFYVGGQAGYGASNMQFGGFNSGLIDRFADDPLNFFGLPLPPPEWPELRSVTNRNTMFGGFAGYNAQYENVIVGVEGNYMHGTFTGSSGGRNTFTTLVNGVPASISTESSASMTITDFGSLRLRGGYVIDNFLPYAFVGFAMGIHDMNQRVGISGTGFATREMTADNSNQFLYGYAAGLGLDWKLLGGLFVRAEYEFLQFTSTVDTSIHSVRGAVGYKF